MTKIENRCHICEGPEAHKTSEDCIYYWQSRAKEGVPPSVHDPLNRVIAGIEEISAKDPMAALIAGGAILCGIIYLKHVLKHHE